MKRIYVDFNTMQTDERERVFVNTMVTPGLAEELQPGMPVTMYDECLEVTGVLEFEPARGLWYGVPDWSTRREL
jgi:hypothetical protein